MKKLVAVVPLLVLSPFLAASWRQHTPPRDARLAADQSLEARVAALEVALAAEKMRGDETRALLDQTLAYLEQQSKGAQAMLGVLQESEQQGFAVGENWRSREILLAGMRAYWSAAGTGLPRVPAAAPAQAEPAPAPARPARQ